MSSKVELASLTEGKLLINTVNAHSFNTAKKDQLFADALTNGDVLILDGVSIVKACKWIKAKSQSVCGEGISSVIPYSSGIW